MNQRFKNMKFRLKKCKACKNSHCQTRNHRYSNKLAHLGIWALSGQSFVSAAFLGRRLQGCTIWYYNVDLSNTFSRTSTYETNKLYCIVEINYCIICKLAIVDQILTLQLNIPELLVHKLACVVEQILIRLLESTTLTINYRKFKFNHFCSFAPRIR